MNIIRCVGVLVVDADIVVVLHILFHRLFQLLIEGVQVFDADDHSLCKGDILRFMFWI